MKQAFEKYREIHQEISSITDETDLDELIFSTNNPFLTVMTSLSNTHNNSRRNSMENADNQEMVPLQQIMEKLKQLETGQEIITNSLRKKLRVY